MKLITWNIQTGRGADGRTDLERIVAHAQRVADFDVLCLQEVSSGYADSPDADGTDQFAELARLLPNYRPIEGIATNVPGPDGRRRFGNMILSRYPVLQIFPHLLPWPVDSEDFSMQRIMLEATLDTPLGLIRVMTTHLEYYSATHRRAQVERLRQLHQEAVAHARKGALNPAADGPFFSPPRGAPAILTGDFNFLPDAAERKLLLSPIDSSTPSFQDAWNLVHGEQAHAATIGVHDKTQWPDPPFTFDFIFVSEDLAGKVKDIRVDFATDASDHQPMMIELG